MKSIDAEPAHTLTAQLFSRMATMVAPTTRRSALAPLAVGTETFARARATAQGTP